jgi:hypothetical protein
MKRNPPFFLFPHSRKKYHSKEALLGEYASQRESKRSVGQVFFVLPILRGLSHELDWAFDDING